jgi:hypothetical protein
MIANHRYRNSFVIVLVLDQALIIKADLADKFEKEDRDEPLPCMTFYVDDKVAKRVFDFQADGHPPFQGEQGKIAPTAEDHAGQHHCGEDVVAMFVWRQASEIHQR